MLSTEPTFVSNHHTSNYLPTSLRKPYSGSSAVSYQRRHCYPEGVHQRAAPAPERRKGVLGRTNEVKLEGVIRQKGMASDLVRGRPQLGNEVVVDARDCCVEGKGWGKREVRVVGA